MGLEIINKFRGPSIIRVTNALGATTINLSQLSANTNTENVISAVITSAKWSLQPTTGNFIVSRGNPVSQTTNTVLNTWQTGYWQHDEGAKALGNTPTGNIIITLVTDGTAIFTLSKDCTYNVDTSIL
jgi:hypothetical protein